MQTVMLAIETSQRAGGVALRDPSGHAHVEMLSQTKRHDDDLLPAIDRLFSRAQLKPKDLEAVGVSIGPGGFTGLRIAVSTAKMFAEALGAKLIAVPSAMVAAESSLNSANDTPQRALVALAVKGNTFWSTRLERQTCAGAELWAITGTPSLTDAASADLKGLEVVLGDEFLPPSFQARCVETQLRIIAPAFNPLACLKVARRMLHEREFADPLKLTPLYPRQPEAVSLWEAKSQSTKHKTQS